MVKLIIVWSVISTLITIILLISRAFSGVGAVLFFCAVYGLAIPLNIRWLFLCNIFYLLIYGLIICYKKLYNLCSFLKILIKLQKFKLFNKKGFHFDYLSVIMIQVVFMFNYDN